MSKILSLVFLFIKKHSLWHRNIRRVNCWCIINRWCCGILWIWCFWISDIWNFWVISFSIRFDVIILFCAGTIILWSVIFSGGVSFCAVGRIIGYWSWFLCFFLRLWNNWFWLCWFLSHYWLIVRVIENDECAQQNNHHNCKYQIVISFFRFIFRVDVVSK